jgi:membrane protein CcdC involved in cytochrome C biogenesis
MDAQRDILLVKVIVLSCFTFSCGQNFFVVDVEWVCGENFIENFKLKSIFFHQVKLLQTVFLFEFVFMILCFGLGGGNFSAFFISQAK